MTQTIITLAGIGAALNAGVLTIDFTAAGRDNGNLDDASNITPEQAMGLLADHLGSLSAQNDLATAAIGASPTAGSPTYVTTRGGTAVTQMRKSITVYQYYAATDSTTDPDNLIT